MLPPIKVGQVWRRADGKIVTVFFQDSRHPVLPFHVGIAEDSIFYYGYNHKAKCASANKDLVELIADAPADPAPQPDPEPEPTHAPQKEWDAVYHAAAQLDPLACGLLELRDRVVALEAAVGVAGNPGHASAAPAGVSVDELADCLPANAWAGPEGYSRQAFARHLLDHPRIGPLLRGEGAGAPKRVVLAEDPPLPTALVGGLVGEFYLSGYRDAWAKAYAMVERQQQGGQADG